MPRLTESDLINYEYTLLCGSPAIDLMVAEIRTSWQERGEAQAALRTCEEQLAEERKLFPSPGVWLVTERPGQRASTWLGKVVDVPDPIALARVAQHTDAIAQAVLRCWALYQERGQQSPHDVAQAIVRELARGD